MFRLKKVAQLFREDPWAMNKVELYSLIVIDTNNKTLPNAKIDNQGHIAADHEHIDANENPTQRCLPF